MQLAATHQGPSDVGSLQRCALPTAIRCAGQRQLNPIGIEDFQ
ncbi:MAG: hypothetical protein WCB70_01975 [Xanthobacteraceae bacterium]